jgi:prepilin peptidase CpaA
MVAREVIWASVLLLTFAAAVLDWRSRKIPNWLTVSGILAGIILRTTLGGWPGAKSSLEGVGLALGLLLPLVLLRALGAGDWKLMGAVGAFMGPALFLFILFGSILASGLMSAIQTIKTKRVKETFLNIVELVRGFVIFGFQPNPHISLDNPKLMKIPFGMAVAVSTAVCFVVALVMNKV